MLPRLAAVLVLAASVVAGCGSDDPAPAPAKPETVQKLPKLPPGWHEYVSHRAGFAIGRPPGWRAEFDGTTTLLRSPDRLVAVSISADRSNEAIEFPLGDYALGAVEALPGLERLEAGRPRRFEARYDAFSVAATGTKQGIRQRLELIAMRRDAIVTYAILLARNAEEASGFYAREAIKMIRTLRGRPVG